MSLGYGNLRTLALIPARAGSKGISNKNLAPTAGRPLIEWTIAAARAAGCLDRIVVSTDGPLIAGVARAAGAEVPFLRPAELAGDAVPTMDVVWHAEAWLREHERYVPDLVMVLQPTTPLRTAEDIVAGLKLLAQRQADSVVAICEAPDHPFWMKRLRPDGRIEDFLPQERVPARRQDLPSAYALNGALYVARREPLLAQRTFMLPNTCGYVMPAERSLDVDTRWDLELADFILSRRQNQANETRN